MHAERKSAVVLKMMLDMTASKMFDEVDFGKDMIAVFLSICVCYVSLLKGTQGRATIPSNACL